MIARAVMLPIFVAWFPAVAAAQGDFTKRAEFSAYYAYLDVPQGAPTQAFYSVNGIRTGATWNMEATGRDPTASGAHAECRAKLTGRTVGPNRIIAGAPGGPFGQFELRREREYIRLVSVARGACVKEGLYLAHGAID